MLPSKFLPAMVLPKEVIKCADSMSFLSIDDGTWGMDDLGHVDLKSPTH